MQVIIKNIGGTQIVYPVLNVIGDSYVTINNSSFSNAYSLEVGMEAELSMNVSISPSAPIGHLAEFMVNIFSDLGDGPSTEINFTVPVGQVTANFESGLGSLDWDFACSGLGCSNWDVDNSDANSGSSSAQSGLIGDNQSSDMSVTLDVTADGIIEFYYKVSAEYSTSGNYFYDGLEFYIDNTLKGQYQTNGSGDSPWTYVSYDVSAGEHTFRWSYVKDGGGGSTDCVNTDCADAAWIDDVVFPPAYMEPEGMPGDVNMDEIINILDVIVIINMILGVEADSNLADLNGDGDINIQDIILVINLILSDNLARTNNFNEASIIINSNTINIFTDAAVGGIELHTSGDYNLENIIMPDGWNMYNNANTIVMIDIEGKGIHAPIELEYSGELNIEKNIISDWDGNAYSADVNLVPSSINLHQAYPNPFNPVTSINYELSELDHVSMSIYNLKGQLISTLLDAKQDAGSYDIIWDASNHPSGMYFLNMKAGEVNYTQKLMLIK